MTRMSGCVCPRHCSILKWSPSVRRPDSSEFRKWEIDLWLQKQCICSASCIVIYHITLRRLTVPRTFACMQSFANALQIFINFFYLCRPVPHPATHPAYTMSTVLILFTSVPCLFPLLPILSLPAVFFSCLFGLLTSALFLDLSLVSRNVLCAVTAMLPLSLNRCDIILSLTTLCLCVQFPHLTHMLSPSLSPALLLLLPHYLSAKYQAGMLCDGKSTAFTEA